MDVSVKVPLAAAVAAAGRCALGDPDASAARIDERGPHACHQQALTVGQLTSSSYGQTEPTALYAAWMTRAQLEVAGPVMVPDWYLEVASVHQT